MSALALRSSPAGDRKAPDAKGASAAVAQHQVLGDRHATYERRLAAVGGHISEARSTRPATEARVSRGRRARSSRRLPASCRQGSRQVRVDRCRRRPRRRGLRPPHFERQGTEPRPAEPIDREPHRPCAACAGACGVVTSRPTIIVASSPLVTSPTRALAGNASRPQHHHAVADLQNLRQFMGDEDDAFALAAQPPEDDEQFGDLRWREIGVGSRGSAAARRAAPP